MKVKKSFKFAAAAMMACALCMTSVSALGSVSKNGDISDKIIINGKEMDKGSVKAEFKTSFETEKVSEEVVEAIQVLNENPAKLQEVLKNADIKVAAGDGVSLEHVDMLTNVQNLELVDPATGEVIKDAKNVTMTWEVPNLTANVGVVRVLHYSTVRNVWELLVPDSVDLNTKSITVTFPDLSPVAVVYVPKDKVASIGNIKDYGDGSKPSDIIKDTANDTEAGMNPLFFIAGGIVLLGAAAFAFRKKSSVR